MGYFVKAKTFWITKTAVLLAVLVILQAVTKPLGQLVTGSCVNLVLAITVLFAGTASGATVALVSPLVAFLLHIAPNLITVPAVMAGNTVFILLLRAITGAQVWRRILAVAVSAAAKFAVLYGLVSWVICGIASDVLLTQGVLKKPMLNVLPAMFSWPQLLTALVGGTVAMLCVPMLQKALHKHK